MRRPAPRIPPWPLLALPLLVLLAGCGSDGGGTTSKLEDAASLEDAPYVVVDTASGRVYGRKSIDDLATGSQYRSRLLVFRRIEAGPVTLGYAGDSFAQSDETPETTVEVPRFYLAVHECSQDHWRQLTGQQPWTDLGSELSNRSAAAAAHNLSYDSAQSGIQAANARIDSGTLRLPSEAEWERAARLDDTTQSSYSFSISQMPPLLSELQPNAWTFETAAGQVGPFTVGSLAATPSGFWDLHGNVWELTASGAVRGGSWRDVALQARSANRNTNLERDIPHPLVGVRLALDLK